MTWTDSVAAASVAAKKGPPPSCLQAWPRQARDLHVTRKWLSLVLVMLHKHCPYQRRICKFDATVKKLTAVLLTCTALAPWLRAHTVLGSLQ